MIEREGYHGRMFGKNRVHRAPQIADAFAVNDTHLQNAPFPTRDQIIRDEVLYLARIERVQIQHAVNWQFNRLVIHELQLLFAHAPAGMTLRVRPVICPATAGLPRASLKDEA